MYNYNNDHTYSYLYDISCNNYICTYNYTNKNKSRANKIAVNNTNKWLVTLLSFS